MMNSANTVSSSGSSSNGTNSTQQQQLSQNMQHMSSNPQQGSNPAPGSTAGGLPDTGSVSTTTENLDFSYCDPLHTHANMSLFQGIGGGSQNNNHSTVNQMQATPQTWVIDQSTQQQPQMHQHQPQPQPQQIQYHPFVLQQQQAHQILSVSNAPTGPNSVNAPSTLAGAPSLSLSQQQQQQHPQIPQLIMNSMQHQQQQTKTHTHLTTAPNSASAGVIASQPGVSTIVTGPSGQQMFLGPSATAALLQQHQPQPSAAVPSPVAVTPQQYYTIALPQGLSAAPPPESFVSQPQPQQIVNTSVQIDQQQMDNSIGGTATTSQATSLVTTSNRNNKRKSPAMVSDDKSTRAKVDHQQNLEGEEMSTANLSTTSSVAPVMCTMSQNKSNNVNNTKGGVKIDHISSFDGPPPPQLDQSSKAFENMSPEERRRHERNLREQQRSYKISQQIKELRNVLAESKIPFKPNKFSILLSVVEYIKQLQARAVFLDNEHRKLINTIRQTTEMVNSGVAPDSIGGPDVVSESTSTSKTASEGVTTVGNDAEMLLVQGLDYKSIFSQCSAALGVAALDGRFLACNAEFEIVSGYTKDELERHSLFNLLASEDVEEVFKVMGEMLKSSVESNSGDGDTEGDETGGGKRKDTPPKAYWSGVVSQKCQTEDQLLINISLTRTSDGMPKFFNCALTVK